MSNGSMVQGKLMWEPKDVASTSMDAFRRTVNQRFGLDLKTYDELWRWSCDNLDAFWSTVWDETHVVASVKAQRAIADDAPIYPPPRWFEGARLNFSENLLRHGAPDAAEEAASRTAVIQSTEVDTTTGELDESSITYRELYVLVARAAGAMRARGISVNDCVASYSANNIENLVAFLAASSIGAVWTSAAADFGPEGVLERLRTVRPKLLLSVNAVRYNGKVHDHLQKLQSVVDGLEADRKPEEQKLESVIVVPYVRSHPVPEHSATSQNGSQGTAWTSWESLLQEGEANAHKPIAFQQLDFNHPLWILFSSGTTGKPKAITHRAGGMLLQLSKEHLIHGGLTPDDVFFQHTTTGWMMWNFLIAGLVAGCPIVLYDGSPLKPASVLWDLAEKHGVTTFGTSAAYLGALEKSGYDVRASHPGLKVRQLLSTGSPLRPELYPFVHDKIGADILVGSITGGTDLCSLFAGHNTALPVRAGEIQARNLGMDIGVYDSDSATELLEPNKVGDLVCKKPFPAQPLGFWKQPESKYYDSYYAQIRGVWYHGDFVMLSPHGGVVMLGRSDGILNPGGIRFGSSEIYELLESPENPMQSLIVDSLVVALKTPAGDDEVVCLFVVLNPAARIAMEEFKKSLSALIRSKRSARHVPKFIEIVPDIPKTLNGKKVEVPVKKIINGAGLDAINKATLLNPQSLEPFVVLGEKLRSSLV
ncbi:acetoacetyl-coa synthetase [Moesziomyces antarcticus]|uniref:Probable Acetoacetyl-CoA synthetase n=1 Tax=Pseudozyma antarctica TaxID=84753 RepID=A0A5C3FHW5_PSEA2|nr:acetoacetyl-coa synthetase [Moesziomyces antarcticus]GAK63211.1 acetoacetyl-coa synthetase [Moesziomyces antarcticus]SPO43305.1 probable Acetoacetyl-CoA synthetase [Moesziomyces antarcticus]